MISSHQKLLNHHFIPRLTQRVEILFSDNQQLRSFGPLDSQDHLKDEELPRGILELILLLVENTRNVLFKDVFSSQGLCCCRCSYNSSKGLSWCSVYILEKTDPVAAQLEKNT
ncbi:hypothetical protein ACP4OV_027979 [Aristida adscensionis]